MSDNVIDFPGRPAPQGAVEQDPAFLRLAASRDRRVITLLSTAKSTVGRLQQTIVRLNREKDIEARRELAARANELDGLITAAVDGAFALEGLKEAVVGRVSRAFLRASGHVAGMTLDNAERAFLAATSPGDPRPCPACGGDPAEALCVLCEGGEANERIVELWAALERAAGEV